VKRSFGRASPIELLRQYLCYVAGRYRFPSGAICFSKNGKEVGETSDSSLHEVVQGVTVGVPEKD